jgi:hypothetical protein
MRGVTAAHEHASPAVVLVEHVARIASARIHSISSAKNGSQVIRFGIWMSDFHECCAPSKESVTPLGVPMITNSAPQ